MVDENDRFAANTKASRLKNYQIHTVNNDDNNLTDIWWQRCSADVFSIQAIIYTIHMYVFSIPYNVEGEGLMCAGAGWLL